MSVLSFIIKEDHNFASWAEKELANLYSEAPRIEQIAATVLTYAGPALQTVVTAEAGAPAGALTGAVIQEAQADLTAASGLIYDFGPHPTVGNVVTSVKNNLTALLTAGHVTNAKSVDTVTKVVNSLGALGNALATVTAPKAA